MARRTRGSKRKKNRLPKRFRPADRKTARTATMGIYSEYLDRKLGFQDLTQERKNQLLRISQIRGGRDILVFAADLSKPSQLSAIQYSDLLPIQDQLSNLTGSALDLILETPGGSAEAAEDIVELIRGRYTDIAVIIPGWAKSAGTIMAMGCDEILMEPSSAVGPIDAQVTRDGKIFSADALIEGFDKIKEEVLRDGKLNLAYVPVLQAISPGELQAARNALKFAQELVWRWLEKYKFKDWTTHRTTNPGSPVTAEQKEAKAKEIAEKLCAHRKYLTHGRSIKIHDLIAMGLEVTDYSVQPELADAIRRYHTLLQMTFASNIYKVFETPSSQILRGMAISAGPTLALALAPAPVTPPPGAKPSVPRGTASPSIPSRAASPTTAPTAHLTIECGRCGAPSVVQANLGTSSPLTPGARAFPADNRYLCPNCQLEIDLSDVRRQIEAQSGKPVVA